MRAARSPSPAAPQPGAALLDTETGTTHFAEDRRYARAFYRHAQVIAAVVHATFCNRCYLTALQLGHTHLLPFTRDELMACNRVAMEQVRTVAATMSAPEGAAAWDAITALHASTRAIATYYRDAAHFADQVRDLAMFVANGGAVH